MLFRQHLWNGEDEYILTAAMFDNIKVYHLITTVIIEK